MKGGNEAPEANGFARNPCLTRLPSDCYGLAMKEERTTACSAGILQQELAGCRITKSPLFPDFDFETFMNEVISCRIIKDSIRRQIFYLQNPADGYYLKRSTLLRSKDRRRHALLPFRKGAEWNNLHRLLKVEISVTKPVIKGENNSSLPKMFFLLTKQVKGLPLKLNSVDEAEKIGRYIAVLHAHGVYHADLHQDNIIVNPQGRYCLIDVQEVFFLPWIPHRLRAHNLGMIGFNIGLLDGPEKWSKALLEGYNDKSGDRVTVLELIKAGRRHQQRKYRSRLKRCCKNSTEFLIVREDGLKGYRRRDFSWGAKELEQALEKGRSLKEAKVVCHQGVCIKYRPVSILHRNRCLASWKMSRAMEVRGISVPRSLAYLVLKGNYHFLSELLDDGLHLNNYLSSIAGEKAKRLALKNLALWLREIHEADVWQRDFKSSNIIWRQGCYYMIDLDGVRIRRLKERDKVTNLAQLNASLSNAVTLKDRLLFFSYYTAGKKLSRRRRREYYKKIWDITKTKGTTRYGLYLEKFDLCLK